MLIGIRKSTKRPIEQIEEFQRFCNPTGSAWEWGRKRAIEREMRKKTKVEGGRTEISTGEEEKTQSGDKSRFCYPGQTVKFQIFFLTRFRFENNPPDQVQLAN